MKPTTHYHVIVEEDEDGVLVGSVPELPGCHSQAKDLKTLERRMKEAIELYLEARPAKAGKSGEHRFVGVHTVEL
jgi:predicted RNase H-like HicB family nuclease